MTKVKAFFLDMDGTILHKDNFVSDTTVRTIDALKKQGYKVFLATGRAHNEIHHLVPENFSVDGIVSSNGTLGMVDDKEVFKHSLTLASVTQIVEKARQQGIYYEVFPFDSTRVILAEDKRWAMTMFEADTPPGNVGESEWFSRKDAIKDKVEWVTELVDQKFSKIYLFSPEYDKITAFRAMLGEEKENLSISVSNSSRFNAETMPYNVDKGTGIKEMIEYFGIKQSETLVIGDSDNDRAMFAFGQHTVAMKNARPEIQALCDEVTSLTNEEDGAAHYLQQKFLTL